MPEVHRPEVTWHEFVNTRLEAERDYVDARLHALGDKVTALNGVFDDRMRESETNRNDALTKAAKTIQDGLDKAERQLQVALDKAQNELRLALTDAEKRVNEKFESKDQAAAKSEKVLNERLEQMNQFREQIGSERLLYVTRDMLEQSNKAIREQMDLIVRTVTGDLRPMQNKQVFMNGATWAIAGGATILVTILSIVVPVAIHFLSK